MKHLWGGMVVVAITALSSAGVLAQAYPTKPVRLIVPFPPGGATDTFSRTLAVELTRSLGQQVIVENRPGAGTTMLAAERRSPFLRDIPTIAETVKVA